MKTIKWIYLLTGLMAPIKRVSSNTESALTENIDEINLKKIGVRLKKVFLTEKEKIKKVPIQYNSSDSRFIFYINDGLKNDNLAQKFADAVMASLALAYDEAMEEIPTAICIPEDLIKKGRFIAIKDIVGGEGIGSEIYFRVMHSIGIPSGVVDYVWRIVPAIVESKSIMDAASFYRESIMQAWVADDDVFEIMQDDSNIPKSQAEKARVETAYQNAFKAIEAIIGEPPKKDERKLRMKLSTAGINPDEMVGYELYGMKPGKEILIKKVADMHETRDKMAAHGKTSSPRIIGYCELKDKQALARYIILSHIENTQTCN